MPMTRHPKINRADLILHTGVMRGEDGRSEAVAIIVGPWSSRNARQTCRRFGDSAATAIRQRPRYGDRLSLTAGTDGWSAWERPMQTGYRLGCCDCGLIHHANFRVRQGAAEVQFRINKRATAAARRGKRFAAVREVVGK